MSEISLSSDSDQSKSVRILRLPAEEHEHLKNKYRLEEHYRSPRLSGISANLSSVSRYPSSRKKSSDEIEHRFKSSEIRHATRKALGPSFDFSDDSFTSLGSAQRRGTVQASPEEHSSPIPQRYLDEYNRWCYEDEMSHEADQYKDDMAPKAPWRHHENFHDGNPHEVADMVIYIEKYRNTYGPSSGAIRRIPTYRESGDQKPVPMMDIAVNQLKSKFSWDADDENDEEIANKKMPKDSKRSAFRRKFYRD